MKRILLLSLTLILAIALQAQLEEDFSPAPTGWILDQGAQFNTLSGNGVVSTPAGGGNNHARIGTPAVTKTSNTVKVCFDIHLYTSNLNAQLSFPCDTYVDVLFVKSTVTTSNDAEVPANILARVDDFLLSTAGGAHCFNFNFPPAVMALDFKVFLSFHAACGQGGTKLVVDNLSISGVDEVCAGNACPPTALDDKFTRTSNSELSFDAVLYGSNINYPVQAGKDVDAAGTDNDQNDTYAHLQWSVVSQPVDGSVVVNADGSCTISRNNTNVVSLTFVYQLCDDGADNNFSTTGDNLCDQATVTVFFVGVKLPVVLTDFTAARRENKVVIKWTTTSESNNSRFELQSTSGAGTWQTIAAIASKAVHGNSDVPLQYEYSETNIAKHVVSYRLIQVDLDGKRTIYGNRMVRGMNATAQFTITPNPATGGRFLLLLDDVQPRDISIADLGGKVIQQWKRYTRNNLTVSGLRPGMYLVHVITVASAEQQVMKLIVTQ